MNKHDDALLTNVHPENWVNPVPSKMYNLVVIGGGTAGLVTAAGAAGLGAKVALIEKHHLGGDCLNTGCVPSKALIRSSRVMAEIKDANSFGIQVPTGTKADFGAVMERMRKIRSGISKNDSAQRFKSLGVDVFLGNAQFTGHHTVTVGNHKLNFKKAVIAAGARAAEPQIPGLKEAGCLTNETVFDINVLPKRLACIGGGPIGCELAQAFHRLGSQVTLLHSGPHILNREDMDAAAIIQKKFIDEGISIVLNAKIVNVSKVNGEKILHYESNGKNGELIADEILVGTGRAPNVEGLGLETVDVQYDKSRGIAVNDYLQTTNPDIYAAGDICMDWKFTHAADSAARAVIQNALFFKSKKLSSLNMPWCTYTDPEIAHVGLYEHTAKEKGIEIETFVREMKEVDRAVTDGESEGFVKIHVKKGTDQILGATIVSKHAGEMISEISLAMAGKIGLGKIASVIHPYPTQAEAIRQLGDAFNRTRLTPTVKKLLSSWLNFSRS